MTCWTKIRGNWNSRRDVSLEARTPKKVSTNFYFLHIALTKKNVFAILFKVFIIYCFNWQHHLGRYVLTRKIVSPDFHRSGVSKSKGGKISYPEVETGREPMFSKNGKKVFWADCMIITLFEAVQLKKISKNVEAYKSIASLKIALFVFDFSPFFGSGGF